MENEVRIQFRFEFNQKKKFKHKTYLDGPPSIVHYWSTAPIGMATQCRFHNFFRYIEEYNGIRTYLFSRCTRPFACMGRAYNDRQVHELKYHFVCTVLASAGKGQRVQCADLRWYWNSIRVHATYNRNRFCPKSILLRRYSVVRWLKLCCTLNWLQSFLFDRSSTLIRRFDTKIQSYAICYLINWLEFAHQPADLALLTKPTPNRYVWRTKIYDQHIVAI